MGESGPPLPPPPPIMGESGPPLPPPIPLEGGPPLPPPMGGIPLKKELIRLKLCNRYLEKNPEYNPNVKFSKEFNIKFFGIPTLLLLNQNEKSHNDIHQMVWKRYQRFVNQENVKIASDAYTLKVVNQTATKCGVCPVNKGCLGCPLPSNDEKISFVENKQQLSICWNLDVFQHKYYIHSQESDFFPHSTFLTFQKEGEEKISLNDCFDK
jgi:hypothetical protein